MFKDCPGKVETQSSMEVSPGPMTKSLKLASTKTRIVTQASLEVLPLHFMTFNFLVNSLRSGNIG